MKKIVILLIVFLSVNGYGQNYNLPHNPLKSNLTAGIYPTFLNYNSVNRFHQILIAEFNLDNSRQLRFTGGFITSARFEIGLQQLLTAKSLLVTFEGGAGSFYGTYFNLGLSLGLNIAKSFFIVNKLKTNIYLDTAENSPFNTDTPLWYSLNITIPLNRKTAFSSEIGLPLVSGSYTWFGMGLKFAL